jgi:hypothetical protein
MQAAITKQFTLLFFALCAVALAVAQPRPTSWAKAETALKQYQAQLQQLRSEFGGSSAMPAVKFFLFGMGNRTKLLYKKGLLLNAQTGDTLQHWPVANTLILPNQYAVFLKTTTGKQAILYEDETGVHVKEGTKHTTIPGTSAPVTLPQFNKYKYNLVLRELLHEILINIVDSKPVPNFFVYQKPWRRDGAMMAMCLQQTGNLSLMKDWVMRLNDPYDRNNAGEQEADNLGQTLYLLSLFSNKHHPLVDTILSEAKRWEVQENGVMYIKGRSDFHQTPVYQTKWLKWGLKALGLPDPYTVPQVQDDYAALFWWDYKNTYLAGTKDATHQHGRVNNYPYIDWAADHFHGKKRSPVSDQDYPLTWETEASQAQYNGMRLIDETFVAQKTCVPHTWHAAEIFLYLLELKY